MDLDRTLDDFFAPLDAGDLAARIRSSREDAERRARALPHGFAVAASSEGVTRVVPLAEAGDERIDGDSAAARRIARRAHDELREYLAGARSFFDVPVDLGALSSFHQLVLAEARRIRHGESVAYAELARRVGRPGAARAVGTAMARNPVPIIVPCHRVLRGGMEVGQYAFGSAMKAALLDLERSAPLLLGCTTTRIACVHGCPAAARARRDREVVFASLDDARGVGYRPCKTCRPERHAR